MVEKSKIENQDNISNFRPRKSNRSKSPSVTITPSKRTKKKRIKKKNSKRRAQKGCRCSKSKCLRLHCVCFRNGVFCGPECKCKCCFNVESKKKLVKEVRKATKDINAEAFKSPIIEVEINGQIRKFTKGCSCSKNNCQKNYCDCFKYGLPCTSLCKCQNCKNDCEILDPDIVAKLSKKTSRKKKKIIFMNLDKVGNKSSIKDHILVSKHRH